MPEYKRQPVKLISRGVSLRYPPDLLPEGFYPALNNMDVDLMGVLSVRRGMSALNGVVYSDPVHSLRELEDKSSGGVVDNLIVGAGIKLYEGASNVVIDTGYSGNPLTMVRMRPPQSPSPWMYIADANKMSKVDISGTVYGDGIAPPISAPGFVRGAPKQLSINEFDSTAGWTVAGTGVGIGGPANRFAETIVSILYDTGGAGWACIVPSAAPSTYQVGARCILTDISAGTSETVEMRQVFKAITTTTINAILYDIGVAGLCSITLNAIASEYTGLKADSVLLLGGVEYVRVLSVAIATDGTVSFRCLTLGTYVSGSSVAGLASFRAYTTSATYAGSIGDTITGAFIQATIGIGAGAFQLDTTGAPLNLINIGGRPLQEEDYFHISLKVDIPARITALRIYLNVDPAFPVFPAISNALYYDVDVTDLKTSWTEFFFKVSDLTPTGVGIAQTLNLSSVTGLIFDVTAITGNVIVYPDSFWVGGTYGPDSTGDVPYTIYQRYRASTTGAISNPSPPTLAPLDLMRELGVITPVASTDPQVDKIDLFAIGGTLTEARLIGTGPNSAAPFNFDSSNISNAVNEVLSFTNFQPFPVPDLPHTGTANVSGTSVQWVSGDLFNVLWQAGSQIILNSKAYTLYAPPTSNTRLIIVENAGSLTNVAYFVPEATLGGQPVPFIWGPDPLTNVMFAVGNGLAAGTLFWTNPGNPDTASDLNSYEVCSPSEPLLAGFMYNGSSYVWSTERLFRASAQTLVNPVTGETSVTYSTQEVPNFKGVFSPWAFCVGDLFWQVTYEGIYESTGGLPTSITDETLYPLFAHGGASTGPVAGVNGYYPIDWTATTKIRLFYTRGALYFTYQDTQGFTQGWKYNRMIPGSGWFHMNYANVYPLVFYGVEAQSSTDVLMSGSGVSAGIIMRLGTVLTDNGTNITWDMTTPAFDFGDPRAQKLLMDYMLDVDQGGAAFTARIYADNQSNLIAQDLFGVSTGRGQTPINVINSALHATLALYRNFTFYAFGSSTGTAPPAFYEFEPNALMQPYLAVNFSNQYQSHHFTNYGHIRDGWIMYISTSVLTLTITVDGGTPYTFSIPSSAGIPKKLYLMDASVTPPSSSSFIRKGKIFLYNVTSTSPFVLFTDETILNAKEWGSIGRYQPFKPFVGQTA